MVFNLVASQQLYFLVQKWSLPRSFTATISGPWSAQPSRHKVILNTMTVNPNFSTSIKYLLASPALDLLLVLYFVSDLAQKWFLLTALGASCRNSYHFLGPHNFPVLSRVPQTILAYQDSTNPKDTINCYEFLVLRPKCNYTAHN